MKFTEFSVNMILKMDSLVNVNNEVVKFSFSYIITSVKKSPIRYWDWDFQ
jgi:hypothetical protein